MKKFLLLSFLLLAAIGCSITTQSFSKAEVDKLHQAFKKWGHPRALVMKRSTYEAKMKAKAEKKEYSVYLTFRYSIAFIFIRSFNEKTPGELVEAFKTIKKSKVKKIIFDLCNNTGGDLTSCLNVVKMLVPKTDVSVTLKPLHCPDYVLASLKSWKKLFATKPQKVTPDIKNIAIDTRKYHILFLASKKTSSGGEIFLMFMKKYKVGPLVGQRTSGKYYGQYLVALNEKLGYFASIPSLAWFLPDGSTANGGVKPHFLIQDLKEARLQALLYMKKKK